MNRTEELDLSAFDDAFFAQQLDAVEGLSVEDQAPLALATILTVQAEDGTQRSVEQITNEIRVFMANPLIQESVALVTQMNSMIAKFCMAHGEGMAGLQENLYDQSSMNDLSEETHHHHDKEEDADDDDEEDEDDNMTATKDSRRKRKLRDIGHAGLTH